MEYHPVQGVGARRTWSAYAEQPSSCVCSEWSIEPLSVDVPESDLGYLVCPDGVGGLPFADLSGGKAFADEADHRSRASP